MSSVLVREWIASIARIFTFVGVLGRLAKAQQSLGTRACLSWIHKVEMIARGIFLAALSEATITTLYERVCSYPESSLTLSWLSFACLPYSYCALVAKSFWMELVFDFCHYWVHRACHSHPKLYKLAHKAHHRHHNPSVLCTLQQDVGETVFANFLPALIAYTSLHIFVAAPGSGVLSRFEMAYVMATKIYQEIGGHMGTMTSSSSFPLCMWLPRALGIELRTSDHDFHHAMLKANYCKRFKLWDLVFGTYKKHPKVQF
jgi:sterol desaturase/sphingolipid hydroxylase (fatty acid hydroxylase superfamily)